MLIIHLISTSFFRVISQTRIFQGSKSISFLLVTFFSLTNSHFHFKMLNKAFGSYKTLRWVMIVITRTNTCKLEISSPVNETNVLVHNRFNFEKHINEEFMK